MKRLTLTVGLDVDHDTQPNDVIHEAMTAIAENVTLADELRHTVDGVHIALASPPAPSGWQQRVWDWLLACFGTEIPRDRLERGDRFCEEAIELLQSLGYPRERIAALVDYVYRRESGRPAQEVGGVMVTLAGLCTVTGIDLDAAREAELVRVWTKVDEIRAKQKAKPTGSALPIADPIAAAVDAQLDPLKDALVDAGRKLERRRPHHVWRDRHGRTCVCGAKEGDPEPCSGPAIIGRD